MPAIPHYGPAPARPRSSRTPSRRYNKGGKPRAESERQPAQDVSAVEDIGKSQNTAAVLVMSDDRIVSDADDADDAESFTLANDCDVDLNQPESLVEPVIEVSAALAANQSTVQEEEQPIRIHVNKSKGKGKEKEQERGRRRQRHADPILDQACYQPEFRVCDGCELALMRSEYLLDEIDRLYARVRQLKAGVDHLTGVNDDVVQSLRDMSLGRG